MKIRRLNRILGTILAITLPLTLVGLFAIMFTAPRQNFFQQNGLNMWNMHGMWNNHMNNEHMNGTNENVLGKNYENISKVQITQVTDNILIKASETDTTYIEHSGRKNPRVIQDGDTLKIRGTSSMGMHMMNRGKITLYIGNGVSDLDIDGTVSNLELKDLQITNLDIDGGAGNILLTNITATHEIDIEGGVGNIKVENTTAKNMEVDMGLGSIFIDTTTVTILDIDGGVGNVTITSSTIDTLNTSSGIGNIDTSNQNTINRHNKK